MSFRYEVRLSGEGGQGLVLAGKILAEAAAIYDNLNATQSQSYGPEARGGASRSEVIISDDDIDYPKAVNIDLLLALTQESFDRYSTDVKPGGIVIVDEEVVKQAVPGNFRLLKIPVTQLAREKAGRALVANIVALGIIAGISKIVSENALKMAIGARVPRGTEELNNKAFQIGLDEARRLIKDKIIEKPGK
ncbi:MAG TPA: 2-oxoacid:acceptor oxidoreductase family protein [bacterium]|nr:2-oxoacid:acceptor oxidoreductase family protein [bacterium]HPN42202.1 2-oxoacid:acceptor oxidoreductase family protein [bacterium]